MMNEVLGIVYTVFLGVLTAIFVGIGIRTFLKAPENPWEEDRERSPRVEEWEHDPEGSRERADEMNAKIVKANRVYTTEMERYQGIVATLSVVFATILLALGLSVASKATFVANGLLLGGIFTLGSGVVMCCFRGSQVYKFLVICVSLLIALALGFIKFMPHN